MTESREVLIEAMARAIGNERFHARKAPPKHADEYWSHALDANSQVKAASLALDSLLAHPVAVLSELENAPCQTCGGTGYRSLYGGVDPPKNPLCSACGGSGILGRDGVLRLLGMEQVMDASGLSLGHGVGPDVVRWRGRVVFARVPVPEPSEGEK